MDSQNPKKRRPRILSQEEGENRGNKGDAQNEGMGENLLNKGWNKKCSSRTAKALGDKKETRPERKHEKVGTLKVGGRKDKIG